MITESQKRNRLLSRIQRIPANKLQELDDFISKMEDNMTAKSKVLSFAGVWKDPDSQMLNDLTEDLVKNRERSKRRNNE